VRSRIEGTPSLVIDGRYLVSVDQRGYGTMLRTAEYLIAQRRAAWPWSSLATRIR